MSDTTLMYQTSDEALEQTAVDGAQMLAERRVYEQSRSAKQHEAFKRALTQTMDLWYAHASTTVVLLTQLPEELPEGFDKSRSYARRGWTTFERCSAELGKSYNLTVATWKLVLDVGGVAQRRLPTTPARMAELLESRQFTNGADKAAVLQLYTTTASAVVRRARWSSGPSHPLRSMPSHPRPTATCSHVPSLVPDSRDRSLGPSRSSIWGGCRSHAGMSGARPPAWRRPSPSARRCVSSSCTARASPT